MDQQQQLQITQTQLRNVTEEYQFLEQQYSIQIDTQLSTQRINNQLVSLLKQLVQSKINQDCPMQTWFQNINIIINNISPKIQSSDVDSRIDEINELRGNAIVDLQYVLSNQDQLQNTINSNNNSKDINLLLKACDALKLALNESTERVYQLTTQNKEILNENQLLRDKLNHLQLHTTNQLANARDDIVRQQKVIEEILKITDNLQ
uniref:Uncharacterized protein n=2 Tax=Spironucleus salmonicida TaxID=348837 RepID=V6LPC8_9EUKA|eukprot:EST42579.1 Hypothetical protein SS50377_17896 [Spironucleus salmonicida]